jgi:hypothetical protein
MLKEPTSKRIIFPSMQAQYLRLHRLHAFDQTLYTGYEIFLLTYSTFAELEVHLCHKFFSHWIKQVSLLKSEQQMNTLPQSIPHHKMNKLTGYHICNNTVTGRLKVSITLIQNYANVFVTNYSTHSFTITDYLSKPVILLFPQCSF